MSERTILDMAKGQGTEVYVIVVEDGEEGDVFVSESLSEINAQLENASPITGEDLTVVHGILTSAKFLPPDDVFGVSMLVFVVNPSDHRLMTKYAEEESVEHVAEEVERALSGNAWSTPYSDKEVGIEHVVILYGYELETGYSVRMESLDEEKIQKCGRLTEKAIGR
jgi:hypothetical protein